MNKEEICKEVYLDTARPIPLNLVPEEYGYVDMPGFPYNPQKARELLAEAGYADGLQLRFETCSGRYLLDRESAEAVAGYLEAVGIDVDFVVNEWGVHLKTYRQREIPEMFLMSYFIPTFETSGFLTFLTCDSDRSYYCDDEFDALYESATSTLDPETRLEVFKRMQEIVQRDVPYLFMWQIMEIYGVNEHIRNFPPPSTGEYEIPHMEVFNLKDVYVEIED